MKLKYKEIAARMRERASEFPEECVSDTPNATFRFGSFVVRCRPTRAAVLACAAKFDHTWYGHFRTSTLPKMPTLRRPPDADKRLAELIAECGELVDETEA